MQTQYEAILQVGDRLRSHRVGLGLSPEEVASQIGISRAAIYRYEAGQPIRVDVLGRIADFFGVSLASLIGVGSEYFASALAFFERMRQIEAEADQITVLFGPVSYLLTTANFDTHLGQVLAESVPESAEDRDRLQERIRAIQTVLLARKEAFAHRKPGIVSLVSVAELQHFLTNGFVGTQNLTGAALAARRQIAREEVEHVLRLLHDQPMGIQIGLVEDSMPGSSFQIFRNASGSQIAVSPYRLGAFANIRIGVATITSDQESVALHEQVTKDLWQNSLKGREAERRLAELLAG